MLYIEQQIDLLTRRLEAIEQAMSVHPIHNDHLTEDLRAVVYRVAKAFSVRPEAILRRDRTAHVSRARNVVFYVARERLGFTLHEIGVELGNGKPRDHAGIQYGIERVKDRMSIEPGFRKKVQELTAAQPET